MSTALVPRYLDGQTLEAPPGHRFQLYLGGWGNKYNLTPKDALPAVCAMGRAALDCAKGLVERQMALAVAGGDAVYARAAITTSAFATGLGMEHPTENGFAFLSPYGIPYLPGSGVKGVVRRAAEELALGMVAGGCQGWTLFQVWRLFGFEGDSGYLGDGGEREALRAGAERLAASDPELVSKLRKAVGAEKEMTPGAFVLELATDDPRGWRKRLQWRGALQFWDAFIQPAADKLVMEILTPHHKGYYEGKSTPADCESPVPVCFLAVPPGSSIRIYVGCQGRRLPAATAGQWRNLLGAALDHAFAGVGFGAKTAVGYGALETDAKGQGELERARGARAAERERVRLEAEREAKRALQDPLEREFDDAVAAAPGEPRVTVLVKALIGGRWQGETAVRAAGAIREAMIAERTWRETSTAKNPGKDREHQRTLAVKRVLEGGI